ncbi:MAG TPA: hypothetical protein VFM78_01690, partial [Marinobacter sp.]|nr:hypothetical protein [Marinobacter sp.]
PVPVFDREPQSFIPHGAADQVDLHPERYPVLIQKISSNYRLPERCYANAMPRPLPRKGLQRRRQNLAGPA